MGAAVWSADDEGFLRAYEWAGALAGGAALPRETAATPLGPGEVVHAHFAPVGLAGFFGEDRPYRPSFLLVGGPVGLAVTGAASLAYNARKKSEARRAAVPRWHGLGAADLLVTNQRLVVSGNAGQTESYWYAQTSALQLAAGPGGRIAVQFQPAGAPMIRLDSPWAPVVYVFVHHLVDGRPPSVPLPAGLLERARAQGRLR